MGGWQEAERASEATEKGRILEAGVSALATTVGTGNVAGVAGAIAIGGPGAIFWMWISALLGMCTKFAQVNTITTAIDSALFKYNVISEDQVSTLNLIIGVVLLNVKNVPSVFVSIFEGAFNPASVTGGVVGSFFMSVKKDSSESSRCLLIRS